MEGFDVISGKITDNESFDYIASVAKQRYGHYKKAHHEWIDSVESGQYKNVLQSVRTHSKLFDTMKERFPNSRIESVTEADEVYWSASPKEAKGSDRSLVDCHYDAPFSIVPNGGVIYYRIIIAVNHNNTVTTVFPTENKRVLMDTGDFHGLDYNKDWHCVEGSITPDNYRVLLKLHYLIIPQNTSSMWIQWVRWINVAWTHASRTLMRMSADPQNVLEMLIGILVNVSRFLFNNSNKILLFVVCLALAVCITRIIAKGA